MPPPALDLHRSSRRVGGVKKYVFLPSVGQTENPDDFEAKNELPQEKARNIYVRKDDGEHGPYTMVELNDLVDAGEYTEDDNCWIDFEVHHEPFPLEGDYPCSGSRVGVFP